MASFSAYPQNVTFQTVNVAQGGGSENLLINPRGKINQSEAADGVVAAGQYFCDGWKAGAAGAEVYIDDDGFRLISGSILQLVPNTLEATRNLRANMDILSGTPSIAINGASDNELAGAGSYIECEISGDNSKFTRIIMAESLDLPIYQQMVDELTPCLQFYEKKLFGLGYDMAGGKGSDGSGPYTLRMVEFSEKHMVPAVQGVSIDNAGTGTFFSGAMALEKSSMVAKFNSAGAFFQRGYFVLDARP
ncbi:hypothetical protein NTE27_003337 [Vibrio fluvialis]|nr:hypothetical protein [Vibrio fluvialis]